MAQSAKHVTTTANTAQTVTLNSDYQTVDVINVSGASAIYCRSDGVNPTVKGDDCDVVVAGVGAFTTLDAPGNNTEVRIITPAVCDVAVVGRTK